VPVVIPNELKWIIVNRDQKSYGVLLFLSYLTIAVRILGFTIFDRQKSSRFSLHVLESVIAISFATLPLVVRFAQFIYIPYFLLSIMIIPQVKLLLQSGKRNSLLRISQYGEKLIKLLLYVALLFYLGACAFNFSENNFGDGIVSVKKAAEGRLTLLDTFYFMVITMSTGNYY
jgi:hypothetical protein